MSCSDHLDYCGKTCPECGLEVDEYGNTEDSFVFCSYPDCGCDGERLCMAEQGSSDRAKAYNVEGMYESEDPSARLKALSNIIEED